MMRDYAKVLILFASLFFAACTVDKRNYAPDMEITSLVPRHVALEYLHSKIMNFDEVGPRCFNPQSVGFRIPYECSEVSLSKSIPGFDHGALAKQFMIINVRSVMKENCSTNQISCVFPNRYDEETNKRIIASMVSLGATIAE